MSVVAVIGLGYVGLPLVVEFGKHVRTIGFDIAVSKVESCLRGVDPSRELSDDEMSASTHAVYTADASLLAEADVIIVAVPTPVDNAHIPDFRPLIGSSTSVGRHMKKGATVVYESTVYPGATEEVCIPVLERESGMTWKKDFFVGYSPERINPGDKEHTLTRILKIVSGDTPETLEKVARLYERIIVPGVHRASSIKAAEAAKVIENTQRDLNIALMNELSIIFDKLGIDTTEVLEAAGTKWNFLKFKPGLVGGHCIGVDPYYLTHKAEMLGYNPQVILAGRRINDGSVHAVVLGAAHHQRRGHAGRLRRLCRRGQHQLPDRSDRCARIRHACVDERWACRPRLGSPPADRDSATRPLIALARASQVTCPSASGVRRARSLFFSRSTSPGCIAATRDATPGPVCTICQNESMPCTSTGAQRSTSIAASLRRRRRRRSGSVVRSSA